MNFVYIHMNLIYMAFYERVKVVDKRNQQKYFIRKRYLALQRQLVILPNTDPAGFHSALKTFFCVLYEYSVVTETLQSRNVTGPVASVIVAGVLCSL